MDEFKDGGMDELMIWIVGWIVDDYGDCMAGSVRDTVGFMDELSGWINKLGDVWMDEVMNNE